MKKTLVAVLMFGVMVMLGSGCSSQPDPTTTPAITPTTTADADTAPTALPAPGVSAVPQRTTPETQPAATLPASPPSAPGQTSVTPPPTGEPNRIVIPRIDLDAPIVDVGWRIVDRGGLRFTEWETADNAAGRHINGAKPGEQGNLVLSGHHNTKGEVFRRISDLELAPGDAIYIYDEQGQRFTYIVEEVTDPPLLEVGATAEQRLANARYIQPSDDARVTLVTCWPYLTNTHRVVVVGKLAQ